MKKLLSILALALCFVACQNEGVENATNGDLVNVVLTVDAPELGATRADEDTNAGKNSAFGAIDFFDDADWANYDVRYILEVYDANANGDGEPIYRERLVNCLDKYAPTYFDLRLVPNRVYKFVVFADFVKQGSQDDLYYDTTDLRNITAKTDAEGWNAMNEARDAYFVSKNLEVKTSLNETLTLTRPFAKLRVIATDLDYIEGYSKPGYVEVTYVTEPLFKSFNAINGQLNATQLAGNELVYGFEVKKDAPYTEGYDEEAKNQTLFADYILAREGQQSPVNFKMAVYESKGGRLIKETEFNTQIPIQRNYLTTITGDILTTEANIKISIDDDFDGEYVNETMEEQQPVDAPKVTATAEGNTVTLAWEAVEGAAKYYTRLVAEGNPAFEATTELTKVYENLAWETEYTFEVYAVSDANVVSETTVVTATTAAEPVVGPEASEWGVVGDITNWGGSADIVMYTTSTENLFVAEKVDIKSGSIKIRANKQWNDAKNYGFEVAGKAYADKYYAVITGSGSQNMTPIEYGVYDVYFDLANKRVALMTPGKAYAEAEDGGDPVVVVEGLKEHAWGLIGSFAGSDWANDVVMTVDGDWAVAKNVTIAKNNEFKFRADKDWALSYGSACDVVADKTYNTYNNGGNMKFIGETGAYDIYFSLVSAKFYMTVAGAEAPAEPVALATPVVEASVEGNVVTLTWAAVENAYNYGVTVGTEMPVFVEDTTYVFTGEYETEYTFSVVAVPEDETKFAVSEAAVVTATTEAAPQPETPAAGSAVTVAKFLEMKDTANEFVLTGKITRVVNETYGNFDLTDATGTIYIYGLLTPEGASQKQWAAAGLREGDTITIKGVYNVYNGSAQVKNAIYVSHVAAPFVSAEPVAINADETAATFFVKSNVAWTVSCDSDWVTSYTTSGENDGEIVVVTTVNTLASNRTASFTISGEGVDDFVVTLTQYAAGATDTKGTYTSEDFLKNGTSTGGKYYLEKVNVGGTSYDCLKLGTSSVVGDYTTKAVNESGDLTLSFYAVGWNGKTSKLNVYVDGVKVGETLTLKSNSGAANNSPYTITPSDETDYYSISLSGVTESSKIKFETVSGATRAIIFGVQLY